MTDNELEAAGWLRNFGKVPDIARDKRVRVVLRGTGPEPYEPRYAPDIYGDPMLKKGWPADGKGGCRWKLHRDASNPAAAFDILWFRLA